MKNLILGSLLFGAVAVTVAMATGDAPQNPGVQIQPAPTTDNAAPVAPPPEITPGSPLAQVVKLTQAGVDQGIIMTYVTDSTGTFNLDSDRIIYLTNLGAPNTVITAMMQRDQQLQQQFTAAQTAQPTQPAQPETQTAPPSTTEVASQPEAQPAPVTVNYFYDTLAPYGSWVVINGYGRCWRPAVCAYNPNWQPYCDNGQWVYTDCGWYWNSSYAWGATFHYGRWFLAGGYGWCWCPDTVWAPSWVTWRYSDNYCGWAPLPPGTACQTGVGIVYHGGGVSVGFGFGLAASCFTFVPVQHFCDSHPRNYCAAPAQVTQIYNQTKVINNIRIKGNGNNVVINNGIAVQNVAAATPTPIRQVPVHTIDRSFGQNDHGQLFNHHNSSSPVQSQNPAHFGAFAPTTGQQQPSHSNVITGNGGNHPAQNHFQQPVVNQNPQPNQTVTAPQTPHQFSHARNNTVAMIPQTPVPAHTTPVQTPVANFNSNPQPAPARWQQPAIPRNYSRNSDARQNAVAQNPVTAPSVNYSAPQPSHQQNFNQSRNEARPNYSQPAVAAPQQTAPGYTATQPSSQWSGGHGGNQMWGMR